MADDRTDLLVLRNTTGAFSLLPRAMLEAARVPADLQEELDRLVRSEEVDGYTLLHSTFTPRITTGVLGEGNLEFVIAQAGALRREDTRQELETMAQRPAAQRGRRPGVTTWP